MLKCPHCGGGLNLTAEVAAEVGYQPARPERVRKEFADALFGWGEKDFDGLGALLASLAQYRPLSDAEIELQRPLLHKHMALMPADMASGDEVRELDEPVTVERVARPQ